MARRCRGQASASAGRGQRAGRFRRSLRLFVAGWRATAARRATCGRCKVHVWALLVGSLLVGGLAVAYGGLMLFSPSKWRGLLDRATLADRWSYPVSSPHRGMEIQLRIAGLIIACGGAFFVYIALNGFLALALGRSAPRRASPSGTAAPAPSVFDLAVPAVCALGGLYILLFPDPLIRWGGRKMQPPREIRARALPYLRVVVRATGAIVLATGILSVLGQLHVTF